MTEKYCPKCGKKLPTDAKFCLNCGAPVAELVSKAKSGIVTAAGVLAIIAACVTLIIGLLSLVISILAWPYYGEWLEFYGGYLVIGFLNLIGFVFGIAGGIQSLRRKQFNYTLTALSLLLLASFVNFTTISLWAIELDFNPYGLGLKGLIWAWVFGLPSITLSLLSLVFVAIKKQEFT